MPGWHRSTKKLAEEGKLQVAGIVQEQHPDRAALFMQWKQMTWPLLSDPYNELAITVVPITLLIDEAGVIQYRGPSKKDLTDFIAKSENKQKPTAQMEKKMAHDLSALQAKVKKNPKDAHSHFALGVAYRKRFDSEDRQKEDFANAVKQWQQALTLNPNQYIWRRRIQQYGPRLDKPYSFYDWVTRANREIIKRGETPISLITQPSGAEFATPEKGKITKTKSDHPDPKNLITHDQHAQVKVSHVAVPSTNHRQAAHRYHLTLAPSAQTNWTNDAGPIQLHLAPGSVVEMRNLSLPETPQTETSNEERSLEFEIHPKKGEKLPDKFTLSLFYHICTEADATCRLLRQDLTLPVVSTK